MNACLLPTDAAKRFRGLVGVSSVQHCQDVQDISVHQSKHSHGPRSSTTGVGALCKAHYSPLIVTVRSIVFSFSDLL